MNWVFEGDLGRLLIAVLRRNPAIAAGLLATLSLPPASVKQVRGQTKHVGSTGTIDIDMTFTDGTWLMVEKRYKSDTASREWARINPPATAE